MDIYKLFSIRIYDGNRSLNSGLKNFLNEVSENADWKTRISRRRTDLSETDGRHLIMLVLGNQAFGIVDYHVQPLENSRHPQHFHRKDVAWISDLVIHPAYRKLGLGEMLLNTVQNYSRYLSKKELYVSCPTHQLPSGTYWKSTASV